MQSAQMELRVHLKLFVKLGKTSTEAHVMLKKCTEINAYHEHNYLRGSNGLRRDTKLSKTIRGLDKLQHQKRTEISKTNW